MAENFYTCPLCGTEGHPDEFGSRCPHCGGDLDEYHAEHGEGGDHG